MTSGIYDINGVVRMVGELDIVLRLVLSCILGGLIGLERESIERPAGFRTHVLVCVGSTLIMIVSMYAFQDFSGFNRDPGRIAAQVVSGIGFLGAGTIIKEGSSVKGLTTAASLWVVSGIGLAIGGGFYFAATIATVLVFTTLVLFGQMEKYWLCCKRTRQLRVTIKDEAQSLHDTVEIFLKHNVTVRNILFRQKGELQHRVVDFFVQLPPEAYCTDLLTELSRMPGIVEIEPEQL